MIEITNTEQNVRLKMQIVGYESPDDPTEDWLMVAVDVDHQGRHFAQVDPALEVPDLERLERWFISLAKRQLPRWSHITFTEPCVAFAFLAFHEPTVRISIMLDYELRPPFMLNQFGSRTRRWGIICDLTDSDFANIISGIQKARDRYPSRHASDGDASSTAHA